MPLTKQKKKEVLDSIKDVVSKASAMVFVNFHGLKVDDVTDFRRKLRDEDVNYVVAKKTLAKKALEESGVEGEIPELEGELALAYTEGDVTAPARNVFDFGKAHEGQITITGGIFEGKFVDKDGMIEIAQIPSMQTLRAQFVNVINSPIQGLAVALNQIAENKEK